MKISVNNQIIELQSDQLIDVIAAYGATEPFALAVNGVFVAKADYSEQQIRENDRIDIVAPVFGG